MSGGKSMKTTKMDFGWFTLPPAEGGPDPADRSKMPVNEERGGRHSHMEGPQQSKPSEYQQYAPTSGDDGVSGQEVDNACDRLNESEYREQPPQTSYDDNIAVDWPLSGVGMEQIQSNTRSNESNHPPQRSISRAVRDVPPTPMPPLHWQGYRQTRPTYATWKEQWHRTNRGDKNNNNNCCDDGDVDSNNNDQNDNSISNYKIMPSINFNKNNNNNKNSNSSSSDLQLQLISNRVGRNEGDDDEEDKDCNNDKNSISSNANNNSNSICNTNKNNSYHYTNDGIDTTPVLCGEGTGECECDDEDRPGAVGRLVSPLERSVRMLMRFRWRAFRNRGVEGTAVTTSTSTTTTAAGAAGDGDPIGSDCKEPSTPMAKIKRWVIVIKSSSSSTSSSSKGCGKQQPCRGQLGGLGVKMKRLVSWNGWRKLIPRRKNTHFKYNKLCDK